GGVGEVSRRSRRLGLSPRPRMEGGLETLRASAHRKKGPPLPRGRRRRTRSRFPPRGNPPYDRKCSSAGRMDISMTCSSMRGDGIGASARPWSPRRWDGSALVESTEWTYTRTRGTNSAYGSGRAWASRPPCISWTAESDRDPAGVPIAESTSIKVNEGRGLKPPGDVPTPIPMKYETILVTRRGPTAVVALNRPDKLNAMSMMLKAEVIRALRELEADEHTRTIVLTGSGDKAFTAGADIHEF